METDRAVEIAKGNSNREVNKVKFHSEYFKKNISFNRLFTKIENAKEKTFTNRFLDYVKVREDFHELHKGVLGGDNDEWALEGEVSINSLLLNGKKVKENWSEEEFIIDFDLYLINSLSEFTFSILSRNDLDQPINDLLEIKEPLILVSKEILLVSQFLFSQENWFRILKHDLEFSKKEDTRAIINLLINLKDDIIGLTGRDYVKQYKNCLAFGERESFSYELFEKNQFGHIDIRRMIGAAFNADDKIGEGLEIKEEKDNGILKLKSKYKLNHLEQLIEVFFKIHLDAQFSNPERIECIELLPKVKRVLKNGVGSEGHYFVEGECQKKIDFIKSRNMAEKFIALFVVLDRDLKIFNHTNVVNGMAHGSDIGSFFGVHLFKYNKGRIGLSERSVRAKVKGLNDKPLKILYKEIGLSCQNVNDLLANLSMSKLEFIKNKRDKLSK